MIHVVADGFLYSFGVFYGVFHLHFEESRSTTSWVFSIMAGLSCCIGPISSAFTNKFGCRVATITGAMVAFLGLVLSIMAPDITYLYFTIGVLTGTGLGLIAIPNVIVVACYFEKKRALANGIALAGSGTGTFMMAPLFMFLIELYQWQGALLIISAIMLNVCVFALLFQPIPALVPASVREIKYVAPLKSEAGMSAIGLDFQVAQSLGHFANKHAGKGCTTTQSEPSVTSDLQIPSRLYVSEPYKKYRSSTQSGLMYYKDILYASDPSMLSETGNVVPTQKSESHKRWGFWKEIVDGFFQMFKFSMLKNPRFLLLGICYFFFSLGINIPYVFTIEKATEEKIATREQASLLLSVVGIFNTIARISSGFLVTFIHTGSLRICCTCIIICGIATATSALAYEYYHVVIYCAVFGASTGFTTTLMSLILVELFGLENLTNTFGLLLMLIGVAIFIGAPINGLLYDIDSSHNVGFFFSGAVMTASGILLFIVPYIKTT